MREQILTACHPEREPPESKARPVEAPARAQHRSATPSKLRLQSAICNRRRSNAFAFSLLALLLSLASPALARNWRIADFHSTVAIDDHGGASVTERITLVFVGQYNGIWRSIPVEYPGPGGTNYSLFLKVESVTDENERPLKHEISRDGPYKKVKIYIPGAVDTTKTVLISYSTPNAVRYFDDHDEFYWNVTGNDWPVPIDHSSAMVSLPDAAAGGLRAQAFTGAYGSTSREATADVRGSHVEFETTNPLPMRGGLTVDVFIPKGILHRPGPLTRLGWFLRSNPVVFVPLWTLLVMFTLWYYKGRDPDPGRSVAPHVRAAEGHHAGGSGHAARRPPRPPRHHLHRG